MNKNLVLLSYGAESEYRRAIFCVFSFLSWCEPDKKNTHIIIYTDKTEFFESYLEGINVEYILLTPGLMQKMLAGTSYIHRRKVAVINLTFEQFPGDDLIFLDSDTFFTGNASILLNGFDTQESFMHKREYNFKEGLSLFSSFNQGHFPQAFINYIKNREFKINGTSEVFSEDDYSWNSGVLGLSKDFAIYLPDVFKLTDEFYANSDWFISEQLAFSLILQRKTKITATEEFICHYWGKRQKVLIDNLLGKLFVKYKSVNLIDRKEIRSLTRKWKSKVEVDQIMEQAIIALTHGSWRYGIKKSLQAILKNPADTDIYSELMETIKNSRQNLN